jgi:hypothetical protein
VSADVLGAVGIAVVHETLSESMQHADSVIDLAQR